MAVVTDDIKLAIGFTKDKKKLKQTLNSLERWTLEGYHTRSMQFSALLATLRELIEVKQKRPIIIFQTDGDEVGRLSKWPPIAGEQSPTYAYDMNDVYSEVEKSRTKIYTVVPNDRLAGLSEEEAIERARRMLEKQMAAQSKNKDLWYGSKRLAPQASINPPVHVVPMGGLTELREKFAKRAIDTFVQGQAAAARVAELTGGWTSFLETPEQANEVYGRILADINHRYIVGYYPANKLMDGTLRRVRVEVRGHPEYVVQGRRSYYALPR
jgi:VWFA-related protein